MRHLDLGRSAGVAALLLTSLACGAGDANSVLESELTDHAITVGSFDFTESIVLAELYSQGLEAAGYEVDRAFALGPREFVGPALAAGLIELIPEYAGTAAEFHSLDRAVPTDDPVTTHAALVQALAGKPLVALAAAEAEDANTFVVTTATARRLDLDELSDLIGLADGLTFGGPAECATRPLCLVGLGEVYTIEFAEVLPLDASGQLTLQALEEGHVDVALMFTTDPAIGELGLIELADDRGLQPAENITPLVHQEVVDRWGAEVVEVIDDVSSRLTTAEVRELNRAVSHSDAGIAAVAAAWWAEEIAS